jgi:hypothetical protein
MVAQRPIRLPQGISLQGDQAHIVVAAGLLRMPGPQGFEAVDVTRVPKGALQEISRRFGLPPAQLALTTANFSRWERDGYVD